MEMRATLHKQPTLPMNVMPSESKKRMGGFADGAEPFDEIAMLGLADQKRGEKTDG